MKTTATTNSSPLVFFVSGIGGATQTTSCAAIADALAVLGYKPRLADADEATHSLARTAASSLLLEPESIEAYISQTPQAEADITLLDLSAASNHRNLKARLATAARRTPGLRVIMALTVTQGYPALAGLRPWVEAFLEIAEFVVCASERETPIGEAFDLSKVRLALDVADGRVINIPRWTGEMENQHFTARGMPSDYLVGGRLFADLPSAASWQLHQANVIKSVASLAPWLTGKPIP
jgi:hypothetical protein